MASYTGRCHCGQIEWTVSKLNDDAHILCHCDACKLLSGGEYTINQIADEGDIKINKGTTKTYTYKGDSGNPVHCYYCPNCTAHVYHHQTILGPKVIVRTGLLQESKNFPVGAEIFVKDKLNWQPKIAETVFEGPPQ